MAHTTTHELGHGGGTVDHSGRERTPGLQIRMRPSFLPGRMARFVFSDDGSRLFAELSVSGYLPDVRFNTLAHKDVMLSDVRNAINALNAKYECDMPSVWTSKRGWQIVRDLPTAGTIINHYPDGSAPDTWDSIRVYADATSVMAQPFLPEQYADIHFCNDPNETLSYSAEIGHMDIAHNYCSALQP